VRSCRTFCALCASRYKKEFLRRFSKF
jgi:hypothetical protein